MTSDTNHTSKGALLSRSEHEKRLLERDAAKLFMRRFEQEFGEPMRHIWHNEPAKPDISCYFQNERLDLEVAHLYATVEEARHARNGDKESDERLWDYLAELVTLDPCQQLKTALFRLLNSKAQKHYDSERVWLIIRNVSPIWDRPQIVATLKNFDMAEHPFEQIWILPDFEGQDNLIQVV